MKKKNSAISRRSLLAMTAGAISAPIMLNVSCAVAESSSVTITSYGGSWQDAEIKQAFEPFTKETGIKVNVVPAPDLAKIKAMGQTGDVQLDIWEATGPWAYSGHKQSFWEKLDASLVDPNDYSPPPASDFAPLEGYCAGIAWDPKKFPPGAHPTNLTEFFDLKRFPGVRAMRNRADSTLEMALLADGVAPKDMYPLDLDRAFKSLSRIKSQTKWTLATPQSISLVQSGEVDFSITNNNRVKVTTEPGGGVPLAFSFDQVLIDHSYVVILKGAPNKENAMKLIAFMLRPDIQARLCGPLGQMPVSKKALAMISSEDRKWLPDLNNPNNLVVNSAYWADHFEVVSRRFKEWMLS